MNSSFTRRIHRSHPHLDGSHRMKNNSSAQLIVYTVELEQDLKRQISQTTIAIYNCFWVAIFCERRSVLLLKTALFLR